MKYDEEVKRYEFVVPEGVTLTIEDDDATLGWRNDPAWYVVPEGYHPVACLSGFDAEGEEVKVSVACVGQMRIELPSGERIRYTGDLIDAEIESDHELSCIPDFAWENNAWFEVFDNVDGESYADIYHDVTEAIESALELFAPRKKIGDVVSALAERFTPDYGDLTTDEDGATVIVPSEKE